MTVIKSSAALLTFYEAWFLWSISEKGEEFLENCGLCANLYDFFGQETEFAESCLEEMHEQFRTAGLDPYLPFNKNGDAYAAEKRGMSCYTNPARVKWVADRIADAKGEKHD